VSTWSLCEEWQQGGTHSLSHVARVPMPQAHEHDYYAIKRGEEINQSRTALTAACKHKGRLAHPFSGVGVAAVLTAVVASAIDGADDVGPCVGAGLPPPPPPTREVTMEVPQFSSEHDKTANSSASEDEGSDAVPDGVRLPCDADASAPPHAASTAQLPISLPQFPCTHA
jgi:hypothetical protein